MRARGLFVAVGLSLLWARQADAVKLILKLDPIDVEAPPHPTLVVETARIAALAPTDVSGSRHFAFTVTPIDDYWASVTVDAEAGDTFIDRQAFGHRDRYHVVARPTAVTRDIVDVTSGENEGKRSWDVKWMGADQRAWTRIDWAYTPQDIDDGRYGSLHQRSLSDVTCVTAANVDRIFLRVVTFRMNGKTEVSRLWLTHDGDDVTIHDGIGTAPTRSPSAVAVAVVDDAPRPVPVDPMFRVDTHETPRFRVVSTDGTALPARLLATPARSRIWSLAVSAPEGTTFTVERFPNAPGAPTARVLRATSDRSHDEPPQVVGQSHRAPIYLAVELADADTWGSFDVTSTDGATGAPITPEPDTVHDGDADTLFIPAAASFATPRILVTITPSWSGVHGTSWTGWMEKASVDAPTIVEQIRGPQRHRMVVVDRVAPASNATVVKASDATRLPVRPVLVVILLLGLAALRPRIFDAWTR